MENPWFRMTLEMPEVPFRMRPLRPLTDEELERLSARQDVLHIEREPKGELEVRLVGGTIAGAVAADLMCELYAWSHDAGVGRVLPNVGYFLSDGSMRGPRVSWVPEVTYAVHKEREGDGFLRGAPPFVIEVVSSQRTPKEWRERMEIWMENGVELGWLFDPSRKTVEVYRAGRALEELHKPATMYGEGPIAGFVLEVEKVWG